MGEKLRRFNPESEQMKTHQWKVFPFHVIHKSCPLPASEMTGKRVTIVFGPAGSQETLVDDWSMPRPWQRPGPWRGFTFFEPKKRRQLMKHTGALKFRPQR